MRIVIQRVSEANVVIDGRVNGEIGQGFMILLGIGSDDTLFALVDGKVKFERLGKDRKQVSVYPAE